MSNVVPLLLREENIKLGKMVFTRTEQMKRRVRFLLGLRDKGKIIRKRTVRRCLEVIGTKGALLSESLHSLRENNPQMLRNVMQLYVDEVITHGYIRPGYKESTVQYLQGSQVSDSEIYLVTRMIEKLGVSQSDFHQVITGRITQDLQVIENQQVYELMRKLSSTDVLNVIKSLKGSVGINKQ